MRRGWTLSAPIALAGAFTVWALHFLVLYGFAALACARGFADTQILGIATVPAVGGIATVLAAGGCIALLLRAWRTEAPRNAGAFLRSFSLHAAALALLAIAWNALPLALVGSCR